MVDPLRLEGRGIFPGLSVAENLRLAVSRTVPKPERSATVDRALELADAALILRRGRVVWSGPAAGVGADLLDHYLGVDETAVAAAVGEEVP